MTFSKLPERYFKGNTFRGLEDEINGELTDLLTDEDVTDELFSDVAQAANDAMMIVLAGDLMRLEEALAS